MWLYKYLWCWSQCPHVREKTCLKVLVRFATFDGGDLHISEHAVPFSFKKHVWMQEDWNTTFHHFIVNNLMSAFLEPSLRYTHFILFLLLVWLLWRSVFSWAQAHISEGKFPCNKIESGQLKNCVLWFEYWNTRQMQSSSVWNSTKVIHVQCWDKSHKRLEMRSFKMLSSVKLSVFYANTRKDHLLWLIHLTLRKQTNKQNYAG